MDPKIASKNAWYALRRTLPVWSFEENLAELVECLPRYGVDELIVKVDTEEFSHGQPPFDWVQKYQSKLFQVKSAMEKLGILFSINPWITVGHNDRGRDSQKMLPGLQTMVGDDGTQCANCACPLSLVWREHVTKIWTLYAESKPHVMWIEDDIRTFNHRPVRNSCFCPLHMQRFSERVGQTITREMLVAVIAQPGTPHPWRAEFLDMQAEIIIETVAFLAKIVHATSPETSLGLMSSGARTHVMEGRRWKPLAQAVADGRPLYSRAPLGNYHEVSMQGLYYSHDSIKLTRHVLLENTIEQTEVENVPFTQYSKSVNFTFLQMAISFAYGSHGVTMNLFDHAGTPMESERAFGEMLAEKKPLLNALAERAQQPGTYQGVRLLFHEKIGYTKKLSVKDDLRGLHGDGEPLMQMFESHGIPTTYTSSPVLAISGQDIRAFSDAEIKDFLSQGLWLDAVAAGVLMERGFGADIGLAAIEPPVFLDQLGAYSAEEYFNPEFGGADKKFLTLTIPSLSSRLDFSVLQPVPEAQVISRIVDPDARRHHVCSYAFENQFGGRIFVLAFDLATAYGPAFNHPFRREQLQQAVRWLGHENVPLQVRGGVFPLTFRKEIENRTILGLFNLTLDPWSMAEFVFSDERQLKKIERLTPDGEWVLLENYSIAEKNSQYFLTVNEPIPFDSPLFLTIDW